MQATKSAGPSGAVRALGFVMLLLIVPRAGAAPLDGRALYLQHCAVCHGQDGRGDGPDAALFINPPRNLRTGYLDTHSTAEVVQWVLDGRRQRLALDLPALRERTADVESIMAHLRHIPEVDWGAVDQGQVLFGARCAPCHGPFGRPVGALPPGVRPPRDLSDPDFQRASSEGDILIAVRHGRDGMPALTPRLSEKEARQVAAFVRVLSPGYATYTTYCAQCHGDHGIGVGSFGESYPVPTVVFDRAYFARRDPAEVRRSVRHMLDEHRPRMPHFRAVISEPEATAIVDYLHQLSAAH
jgi:mono/diheme cytochrome c family protein